MEVVRAQLEMGVGPHYELILPSLITARTSALYPESPLKRVR